MRRLVAAACMLALGVGAAFAQNARLNAMSGFSLFGDATDVYANPAYMKVNKNMLQATYSGQAGVDNVLGIAGLGKLILAGVTYNHTPVVVPNQALPHLLLGIGIGKLAIGTEWFYERAVIKHRTENERDTAVKTITQHDTSSSALGVRIGATLDLSVLALDVVFRAVRPMEETYDLVDRDSVFARNQNTDERTRKNNANHWIFDGGVRSRLGVGDFGLWLGLNGSIETSGRTDVSRKYHQKDTNNVQVQPPPAPPRHGTDSTWDTSYTEGSYLTNKSLALTVGLVREFEDLGLKVGANLEGTLYRHDNLPDGPTDINPAYWANTFTLGGRAALEKEWTRLRWFDAIRARTGLSYFASVKREHWLGDSTLPSRKTVSYKQDVKNARAENGDGFEWTLGAGVAKGVFAFDVCVSPTAVVNAFKLAAGQKTGQDLASVTLTVDFKNLHRSSASSAPAAAPVSEPAIAPASEPAIPPPSEPAGTPDTSPANEPAGGGSGDSSF